MLDLNTILAVSNQRVSFYKKSQNGAVLVVSLVMLLILTLIGVSGMSSVTLEEKMVSNMQNANKSFQGAEAALSECESFLRDQKNHVFLTQNAEKVSLGQLKDKSKRVIATGLFPVGWWEDEDFWKDYGNKSEIGSISWSEGSPDGLVSEPRCFTQYIGNGASSLDSDTSLYPDKNSQGAIYVYRVTGFSYGADRKSQSVVESVFVRF